MVVPEGKVLWTGSTSRVHGRLGSPAGHPTLTTQPTVPSLERGWAATRLLQGRSGLSIS